jgi:hypothetical protein
MLLQQCGTVCEIQKLIVRTIMRYLRHLLDIMFPQSRHAYLRRHNRGQNACITDTSSVANINPIGCNVLASTTSDPESPFWQMGRRRSHLELQFDGRTQQFLAGMRSARLCSDQRWSAPEG